MIRVGTLLIKVPRYLTYAHIVIAERCKFSAHRIAIDTLQVIRAGSDLSIFRAIGFIFYRS